MARGALVGAVVALLALPQLAGAALAQTEPDEPGATAEGDTSGIDLSAFVLDIEATILDLSATIADIDAGTAVTEGAVETTITLEADVFFDFDVDVLRDDAVDTLAEVAADIAAQDVEELRIVGHTDAIGTDEYNQGLSERRAASVEAFLAERLDGVAMTTEGRGATEPVAPNETTDGQDNPEGRAQNRRVEITFGR